MIACVDVAYETTNATAAAAVIRGWSDASPIECVTARIEDVADYRPGFFYERELPCLLRVLAELAQSPQCILIDGYVWLAPDRPGLGAHLFEALGREYSIIGVAKSPFAGNIAAVELLRGRSTRPLFVTACGIEPSAAVASVRSMHGKSRIPTVSAYVDALARGSKHR